MENKIRNRIRCLLLLFIIGLALNGATAIPLETELTWFAQWTQADVDPGGFDAWIIKVRDALVVMNASHPFISYGTDWLAFAHFVLAVVFIGPLRDPVRNVWVIQFGMIACVMVLPFALIMGGVRGIPMGWRLIDCSFGVLGFIPLWYCLRLIKRLEESPSNGRSATP